MPPLLPKALPQMAAELSTATVSKISLSLLSVALQIFSPTFSSCCTVVSLCVRLQLVQVACAYIVKHHIRASVSHQLKVLWRTCGDDSAPGADIEVSLCLNVSDPVGDSHLTAWRIG
jgi:hypothetical protein